MNANELTKHIAAFAASPPSDLTEEARAGLYAACSQLRDTIMSPLEATLRFSFGVGFFYFKVFYGISDVLTAVQAHETAALQLGIDMKLFDIAVAAGGPLTVSALAEKASADALLVG
jgi:hypothetical protein